MTVPFVDLKRQYDSIKDEIDAAIQAVVDSSFFSGGPLVEKFENEFAEFCQSSHCVGVGSGTEALWLTLCALGIGDGDEVITVSNTFIATVEAISFCGAKPVFVDIDANTYTMDPWQIETAITPHTKAILPVHLFGQMADMDPIMAIARKNDLHVIEDACQSHGAEYKGRKAGSIGIAAAFSFYPSKNLGAFGEAGAVVTNDQAIANKIRKLKDHGQLKKYYHDLIGWNARMDGIQAAVLRTKLKRLNSWNNLRRELAQRYNKLLGDIEGITLPTELHDRKHVYHVYAIRVKNRDYFLDECKSNNIMCSIHYPVPVHRQAAFLDRKGQNECLEITEECAKELISLPMFPELEIEQVEYVSNCIKNIRRKIE